MLLWKKDILIIFGFFYIIHQNFLFGNPKKAILLLQRKEIFTIFDIIT